MDQQIVKVKTLSNFIGELPQYATGGSSGMDVRAAIATPLILQSFERALVPTGLIFEIPRGYEIQIRPRSGLALKHGITVVNTPGTIDADYRGEVGIILINLGKSAFVIEPQERIAQLVLSKVAFADFKMAEVSETTRGAGGFGSTGRA